MIVDALNFDGRLLEMSMMVKPSVQFLERCLSHPWPVVRGSAAGLLGYLRRPESVKPLVRLLGDADKRVREQAVRALVRIGARGVRELIDSWQPENRALWPEMSAVLVKIGEPAVGLLIDALDDRRETVRMLAIGALGWIGDARAARPLAYAMCHEYNPVRVLIALALVKMGEAAIEPLIETLYGENEQVWSISAKALQMIGPAAVIPLIEALSRPGDQGRILAATVLGWIGDERAVEPLTEALTDPHAEVCEAACEALSRLGYFVPIA